MTMTCRQLVELMMDYVHGDLAPDQATWVETHVGDCTACFQVHVSYRFTVTVARRLPAREMPPSLVEKLKRLQESLASEQVAPTGAGEG